MEIHGFYHWDDQRVANDGKGPVLHLPDFRRTGPLERLTWDFGVDPGYTQHCFLGAGKEGPVATVRLRPNA